MRKEQLIELVQENLAGGAVPAEIRGKYHPLVIEKYLEMVYDDMLGDMYKVSQSSHDFSLFDNMAKPYSLTLQKNTVTGYWYSRLPSDLVSLPSNGGVRAVYPPGNPNFQFQYLDNNSGTVWSELEASVVEPRAGYKIKGDIIEFDELFPYGQTAVEMLIVASFGSLSATDNVTVPTGGNETIFQKVYTLMGARNQTPQDNYADGNTKQI